MNMGDKKKEDKDVREYTKPKKKQKNLIIRINFLLWGLASKIKFKLPIW